MQIENSVALVTDADRGVGRQHVAKLIGYGAARVYADPRNAGTPSHKVAPGPQRVVPLGLAVTDKGVIQAVVRMANRVTLFVNDAGSLPFGGVSDVVDAGPAQEMAVNKDGLRQMTWAFAPIIETNGGDVAVNMLTMLTFIRTSGLALYNASKTAGRSMAIALHASLRPNGIQVINALSAGIDTDMLAGADAPKNAPEAVVHDVLAPAMIDQADAYLTSVSDGYGAWRTDRKSVEAAFAETMSSPEKIGIIR